MKSLAVIVLVVAMLAVPLFGQAQEVAVYTHVGRFATRIFVVNEDDVPRSFAVRLYDNSGEILVESEPFVLDPMELYSHSTKVLLPSSSQWVNFGVVEIVTEATRYMVATEPAYANVPYSLDCVPSEGLVDQTWYWRGIYDNTLDEFVVYVVAVGSEEPLSYGFRSYDVFGAVAHAVDGIPAEPGRAERFWMTAQAGLELMRGVFELHIPIEDACGATWFVAMYAFNDQGIPQFQEVYVLHPTCP